MDQREKDNWKKIKEVMEATGKTDNMFYKRAVEITKSGKDPLAKFLGSNDT